MSIFYLKLYTHTHTHTHMKFRQILNITVFKYNCFPTHVSPGAKERMRWLWCSLSSKETPIYLKIVILSFPQLLSGKENMEKLLSDRKVFLKKCFPNHGL